SICKSLFATPDALWVGTNKGLNRVQIRGGKPRILKIGVLDGLPSDNITSLLIRDSMAYVGTPEGLSFFNHTKIGANSICHLRLLETLLPENGYSKNGTCYLPYKDNSVQFILAGISARSAGQIDYYYRMRGLQDEWEVRNTATVEYPSLPPGDYMFEIFAVNRFGVRSNLISVPVVVATPFWQTPWLFVLAGLAVALISGAWFRVQNAAQQKKIEEKAAVEKRLAELEQQALQAQMNPHFIFNSLNSIQQFFLSNDGIKANKFLSMFATLVRETLHFSEKKTIRVADELRYLKRYLELEQMRFGNQFDYDLQVGTDVTPDFAEIPALLLQPYVENAIRHGIRHKTDGKGHILIRFETAGNILRCIVRDNGVGRAKTLAMKGKQPIEYQSKGMELGQKRIEALNKLSEQQIAITVSDLHTPDGTPSGTEVVIQIPL
ncbi:MAG: histidine kinase, partial [Chitinophagaceae bacterium]|nr:histidine kinase [Chitinophagaceae bacterium]